MKWNNIFDRLDCLFPCGLIGFGCCLVFISIRGIRQCAKSKSWPMTAGLIVESTIQSEWVRSGSGRIYVVCPKVVYEYQVDGKKYTSSQLALIEHDSANENLARRKAEKYSPGQQVKVYYNPRKPESAVLTVGDPTKGIFPYSLIFVGVLLVTGGCVWLWQTR